MVDPRQPRILIIEHDRVWQRKIRDAVKRVLGPERDESVHCVDLPEQAEAIIANSGCDLIITDFFFVGQALTDLHLAKLLSEHNIPVIVISIHVDVLAARTLVNSIRLCGLVDKERPRLSTSLEPLLSRVLTHQGRANPECLYSWMHISDIHVGADSKSHRFDQAMVCRALIDDAKRAPRLDAIFVTGDIAYRGDSDEYARAARFFDELAEAVEIKKANIFFVPGNHDVDRKLADNAEVTPYHADARRDPRKLDDFLHSVKIRAQLRAKLSAYQEFLQKYFPQHPSGEDDAIDWSVTINQTGSGPAPRLRLVGLSTVWVSDSLDGRSERGASFEPNLVIARRQLDATLGERNGDEIVMLLTHHPPGWMLNHCRDDLERYLAQRRHIHFCGHIHKKAAGLVHYLGDQGTPVRYAAGATHDEEASHYRTEHTYAWGGLRLSGGRWQIGWAPRVYVPRRNEMRADRTAYDLEEDGFNWADPRWS